MWYLFVAYDNENIVIAETVWVDGGTCRARYESAMWAMGLTGVNSHQLFLMVRDKGTITFQPLDSNCYSTCLVEDEPIPQIVS